jgi:hypothetical protein
MKRLILIIPFLLVVYCLIKILWDIQIIFTRTDSFLESWNATEVFISYHGGFVRRGLLGSFMFFVAELLNMNILIFSSTVLMIVAVFVFLKLFNILSSYDKIMPILLLSTVFYGSYLFNIQWFRKDLSIILLFIIFLKEGGKSTQPLWLLLPFTALLIHELSFLIFSLPILLYYLDNKKLNFFYLVAYFFLTFLMFTSFHGNQTIARLVWENYLAYFREFEISESPLCSIEAIGFNSSQGLNWSMNILTKPFDLITLLFLTFLIVYLVGWLISKLLNSEVYLGKHFAFSISYFLPFSMMYLLGWDYTRWISLYSMSAVVFFSNPPLVRIFNGLLIKSFNGIPLLANKRIDIIFRSVVNNRVYIILFIVVPYPLFSNVSYFNQIIQKGFFYIGSIFF